MEEILKVYENNHVDPPWSHVLVLSLDMLMIGALIWCIREVLRAKKLAAQAQRIEQSPLPLFEGARFVAGHVELAQGEKTAVRVTIEQQGEEKKQKDSYSHLWTEVEREIEAVPFYVRTANGERVRVEPPNDVMLVDKLDQMEWQKQDRRKRRAELVEGEPAIIEGKLERGKDPELKSAVAYREVGAQGWVMKPTKRRGMSISSEGLARRHELRAKAFVRTMIVTLAVGLLAMSVTIPYRLRVIAGENVEATYVSRGTYWGTGKSRNKRFFMAHVKYIDGDGREQSKAIDIDKADYDALPANSGRMWMRVVSAQPRASTLGKDSSVASLQLIFQMLIVGFGLLHINATKSYRRWYEGHLVDKGAGQLPFPPNSRFRDVEGEGKRLEQRPLAADVAPISTDFK